MPTRFTVARWHSLASLSGHLILINVDTMVFVLFLSSRVRSLIIQQEKAQDREKLLLKFIKIMKVCQNLRLSPICHVIELYKV